jgi:hypothetical protein
MDPRKAAIAAILALPLPALAQQAISEPLRIVITKTDCSRLLRHTPSADVAYKPGEGAGGRKVVPADIPGSGAQAVPGLLPEVLEIPLNIKPFANAAWATRGLDDTQASLGNVRYDMAKGTFTINGQPLGGAEQEELAKACAKRGVR